MAGAREALRRVVKTQITNGVKEAFPLVLDRPQNAKLLELFEWLATMDGWYIAGINKDNLKDEIAACREMIEVMSRVKRSLIRVYFQREEDYVYAKMKFS